MLAAVFRDRPEEQVVPCLEDVQDQSARDKIINLLPLLCCPECGASLQAALGKINTWHFQHAKGSDTECALRNGETKEHIALKVALYQAAKSLFPRAKLRFETWLPEAGRKADLLVTLPNDERIAFEGQRSSQTFEDLEQRTKAYQNAGIDITWAFITDEFTLTRKRVRYFARWLLGQGLMVLAAKIYKEGKKISVDLFTVEERLNGVPRILDLSRLKYGEGNMCLARKTAREVLKSMTLESRKTLDQINSSLIAKGFELHSESTIKLLENSSELRYLEEKTLCLAPWYVLNQSFVVTAAPGVNLRTEQDDKLAEGFWLGLLGKLPLNTWKAELKRVEPKPEVRERVTILAENQMMQNSSDTSNKSSQPHQQIISLDQIIKEFGDGVISRKRLDIKEGTAWTQLRVSNGKLVFLRENGLEIQTDESHYRSWFIRLCNDIARGRHLNGLIEIGELGQRLLQSR